MRKAKKTTEEQIVDKIFLIRGQKVMLDNDLAELYGVTTGNLNKAVRRNLKRFPPDFMFQLNANEFKNLIFQNGISRWGGTRHLPIAFTEQGVAMLSSVLNSQAAIQVNIRIIRVFCKIRQVLTNNKDILLKLSGLEKRMMNHDDKIKKSEVNIQRIFRDIKKLLYHVQKSQVRIGF